MDYFHRVQLVDVAQKVLVPQQVRMEFVVELEERQEELLEE